MFASIQEGLTDVIVYAPADEADKKKNRGFCFVDFDTHKNASAAKRKLANGRVRVGNIFVLRFSDEYNCASRCSIVTLPSIGLIQMKNLMIQPCHK